MKRTKKVKHEEHIDEAWLLPYADMLTLLLALFIVMFAMAKVDDQKFSALSKQFNIIMSSHPTSGAGGILPAHPKYNSVDGEQSTATTSSDHKFQGISEEEKIVSAGETIEKQLADAGHASDIDVDLEQDGLRIAIKSGLLFPSGSASLSTESQQLINNIGKTLNTLGNDLIIAGYTDNVPNKTEAYASNWELSAARAISVMEELVKTDGISQDKVSIQAYGEYKPKVPNNNSDNRAKNRRVEIFIIKKD